VVTLVMHKVVQAASSLTEATTGYRHCHHYSSRQAIKQVRDKLSSMTVQGDVDMFFSI